MNKHLPARRFLQSMRSAVKVSSLSMGTKRVKSVVLSQIRRNFVRRNTFDSLKNAHFDLQTIIRKFLDLKGAHLQDLWVLSNTGLHSGFLSSLVVMTELLHRIHILLKRTTAGKA